jgi:hypothetical protein
MDEPSRLKLRRAKEEPRCAYDKIERELPKRAKLLKESELPNSKWPKRLSELPA